MHEYLHHSVVTHLYDYLYMLRWSYIPDVVAPELAIATAFNPRIIADLVINLVRELIGLLEKVFQLMENYSSGPYFCLDRPSWLAQ
jgi:hypothetical protein